MDWVGIQNIANGNNFDGSKQFSSKDLSNIVSRIGQGRKNLFWIIENIATGYAWARLFNPEHKINASFLEDNLEISEAITKAYPNLDVSQIHYDNEEELLGFVNGVKGKLFEIKVANKLNSGERVGDIELESGQFVDLAESPTQEGYDLILFDADGSIEDFYQLKATDSIEYVKSTISSNPDIDIIATSEVAEELDHLQVSNSEISNSDLETELSDLVDLDFFGDFPVVGGVIGLGTLAQGNIEDGVNYLVRRVGATAGGALAVSAAALIGLGGIALPIFGLVGSIFTSKFLKNTIKISFGSED